MSIKNKRARIKVSTTVFVVLLLVAAALFIYGNSSLHPANISDQTIVEKGDDYRIKIRGIHSYDENGFEIATNGFYFTSDKLYVYVGDDGFAYTTDEQVSNTYILGRYNSSYITYDGYVFCGEEYKTQQELKAFFDTYDPIYNFDMDKLSSYISDIINYKKQFYGTATLKIYKGRCVITSVSVGDEKVLEYKNSY